MRLPNLVMSLKEEVKCRNYQPQREQSQYLGRSGLLRSSQGERFAIWPTPRSHQQRLSSTQTAMKQRARLPGKTRRQKTDLLKESHQQPGNHGPLSSHYISPSSQSNDLNQRPMSHYCAPSPRITRCLCIIPPQMTSPKLRPSLTVYSLQTIILTIKTRKERSGQESTRLWLINYNIYKRETHKNCWKKSRIKAI